MKLETTVGWVEASDLVIEETIEDVPCGTCKTTAYFLNGEKVRQDQEVNVTQEALDKAFAMSSAVNL